MTDESEQVTELARAMKVVWQRGIPLMQGVAPNIAVDWANFAKGVLAELEPGTELSGVSAVTKPHIGWVELQRPPGRGLGQYIEFVDTKGSRVWLQDSSSDEEPCAWIFIEGERSYGNPQPHLNVQMAEWLTEALGAFIQRAERPLEMALETALGAGEELGEDEAEISPRDPTNGL